MVWCRTSWFVIKEIKYHPIRWGIYGTPTCTGPVLPRWPKFRNIGRRRWDREAAKRRRVNALLYLTIRVENDRRREYVGKFEILYRLGGEGWPYIIMSETVWSDRIGKCRDDWCKPGADVGVRLFLGLPKLGAGGGERSHQTAYMYTRGPVDLLRFVQSKMGGDRIAHSPFLDAHKVTTMVERYFPRRFRLIPTP